MPHYVVIGGSHSIKVGMRDGKPIFRRCHKGEVVESEINLIEEFGRENFRKATKKEIGVGQVEEEEEEDRETQLGEIDDGEDSFEAPPKPKKKLKRK